MKRLFILLVLCCLGCSKDIFIPNQRIDNVVRVFVHSPGCYSVLYQDGNRLHEVDFGSRQVTLRVDVPEDKPMWVTYDYSDSWNNGRERLNIEIHIHSPQCVDGGAWHRHKGPHGRTNVVE